MKLEFDEYHDLGHPFMGPYCFSQPGGPWRHLKMAWTYQWQMPEAIWGKPLCRLGRHTWTELWESNGIRDDGLLDLTREPDRYICAYCWKDKPTTTA